MPRILVAAAPGPRAILERILTGHDLFCVETMTRAEELLRERTYDLIICTIAFDESKIFDFLRTSKSTFESPRMPFVCARVRGHILRSQAAQHAVAVTCKEPGAAAFLGITDYQVNPEREMRGAIERLLTTGDATQSGAAS